jgi:nitrite reductase (NADH) small subunit
VSKNKNILTFAVLLPSFLLRHQTLLIVKGGIRTQIINTAKMEEILNQYETVHPSDAKIWFKAGNVSDFPTNRGGCIKYKNKQIAVFNFARRNEWYACQNACPHKMEMVLSRGMTGSTEGIPKIACPMHKKTFSLVDGSNLNGDDDLRIATYPVKIVEDEVFVGFLD